MGETPKKINKLVALLLAIAALFGGGGYAVNKLGSSVQDYNCYTAAATSTMVTLGTTVAANATTSLLTCSTASAERLGLFFTYAASTSATTIFYTVEASNDRIQWYNVSNNTITTELANATTSNQDLVDPFVGTWTRISARSTATSSVNLRVATVEALAR